MITFWVRLSYPARFAIISNFFVDLIALRGGVTGVTIFFFLSAYGLTESQTKNQYNFIEYLKRRLLKVFIPLIITNILYYFPSLAWEEISFSIQTFSLYILNIKILDGVTWFCNVILVFYIFFYLSFCFKKQVLKVSVLVLFTLGYSYFMVQYLPNAPYYIYSIVGFPLGMLFSLYKTHYTIRKVLILSCIIVLIFSIFSQLISSYSNLWIGNIYSFLLIIFTSIIITKIRIQNRILSFCGNYSFEIYLLHNKFMVLNGILHLSLWYPITFFILVLPSSLLLKRINNKILDIIS